jgi:hypothetical protein
MKRRTVFLVSSLALASGAAAAGAGVAQAGTRPLGPARVSVTHQVSAVRAAPRLRPQKLRLARRLHTALRHELGSLAPAQVLHVRAAVRRLPHHHGTRAATYSLDELSRSRNVVASAPGASEYTRVDSTGGTVDLWTDPQGRVRYTLSADPAAR